MSTPEFLRAQIQKLEKSMNDVAHATAGGQGQTDYLINVGRYRGFKSLRDSYKDMLDKLARPDPELDDDEEDLDEEDHDQSLQRRPTQPSPVRRPPRPRQRARSWGGT